MRDPKQLATPDEVGKVVRYWFDGWRLGTLLEFDQRKKKSKVTRNLRPGARSRWVSSLDVEKLEEEVHA
jgi:hypothetical protein